MVTNCVDNDWAIGQEEAGFALPLGTTLALTLPPPPPSTVVSLSVSCEKFRLNILRSVNKEMIIFFILLYNAYQHIYLGSIDRNEPLKLNRE
jgi:hypothetical protein